MVSIWFSPSPWFPCVNYVMAQLGSILNARDAFERRADAFGPWGARSRFGRYFKGMAIQFRGQLSDPRIGAAKWMNDRFIGRSAKCGAPAIFDISPSRGFREPATLSDDKSAAAWQSSTVWEAKTS